MRTRSRSGDRRQSRFPEEFRIETYVATTRPPDGPDERPEPASSLAPEPSPAPRPPDPEDDDAVTRFVTEMWKARRWVGETKAEQDAEKSARLGRRHLERAVERLSSTGVTVHDFDGQPYDEGMQLQVLAFQHTPGLSESIVLETVTPAVIRDHRVIQEAEVIVGVPLDDDDRSESPTMERNQR